MQILHALALVAIFFAAPAMAQDCDAVLANGTMSKSSVETNDYARTVYASRIASMTYNEAKNDASLNAMIPIKGIPLEVGFSQSDFSKFQSEFRSQVDLDQVSSHRSSILQMSGDPAILDAWTACMARHGGLSLSIKPMGEYTVMATLQWWPSPGIRNSPKLRSVILRGGRLAAQSRTMAASGTNIGTATANSYVIDRRRNAPVLFVVNTTFGSAAAYLPSKYVPAARTTSFALDQCLGRNGLEGVGFWGPPENSCNGISYWNLYSRTAQSVTSLGFCKGHNSVEGVTLWGPTGRPCANIDYWGTYEGAVPLDHGIGRCVGHGSTLEGHILYGPKGLSCGGFPEWGKFE